MLKRLFSGGVGSFSLAACLFTITATGVCEVSIRGRGAVDLLPPPAPRVWIVPRATQSKPAP